MEGRVSRAERGACVFRCALPGAPMRPVLFASTAFLAIVVAGGPWTRAQVKIPKPPDNYEIQIRYKIHGDRNERVQQFEAMTKFFGSLGFRESETDESDLAPFDPSAEILV